MPKLTAFPKYRHHKPTGRAYYVLEGRYHYLGAFGSVESLEAYNRAKFERAAAPRLPTTPAAAAASLLIVQDLVGAYLDHADEWYARPAGRRPTEPSAIRQALRHVVTLYRHERADAFAPKHLKAVRQSMIDAGWVRTNINRQIGRVVAMFKWGVQEELVAASVHESLTRVSGIPAGRVRGVRESERVTAVSETLVDQVLPFLPKMVAAMVRTQLLTGMRPGELTSMRWSDIDRSGPVWVYTPRFHKTQHLGQDRPILLPSSVQAVLMPLQGLDLAAHVFRPTISEAERRVEQHANRTTPLNQGNRPRRAPDGTQRVGRASDAYTVESYRRAIERACERAFPLPTELQRRRGETKAKWNARLTPPDREVARRWVDSHRFHPHQLRHAAACRFRANYGADVTQALLGHKDMRSMQHYAKVSLTRAIAAVSAAS